MPAALVADKMGLGNTITSVAAPMICKLLTEKIVMGLPLSNVWGNTLQRVGEYSTEQLSQYYRSRTEGVSVAKTDVSALPPFR